MRIAIISDIHSNVYALNEVLLDIQNRNIDIIVCTGDIVGYATRPNEAIEILRKNKILTIMGNYDDAIGNNRLVCGCDYKNSSDAEKAEASMRFTLQATSDENKAYLRDLPKELVLCFNDKKIRFVHGSTRLINEYLREDSKESKEVMQEIVEDILVCGHTHIPYYKYYGEKLLVNAGSVGKPKTNNPNANYVIIDIKTSNIIDNTSSNIEVKIIEVNYDFEKIAKEIEENKVLPNDFARLIREGSSK
ncbi:MAG: metallophosphoesterase family protein [Romboutsia sp.]|uniref:metallophosphoesterase family protein n=1 Tax=Romboutsia sp. TaxID=1965302 RepID=UPI003F3C6B48